MAPHETYSETETSWWERLWHSLLKRPPDLYVLPQDSLLASLDSAAPPQSVADVPEELKARIREEAVLAAFHKLEGSLRLLLHATTPGREPPSAERCREILQVWRYELENGVRLAPDTYCGAIIHYQPELASAYVIDGRCRPGDLLQIRVPCWRLFDRVVIRGEAAVVAEGSQPSPAEERDLEPYSPASRPVSVPSPSSGGPPSGSSG